MKSIYRGKGELVFAPIKGSPYDKRALFMRLCPCGVEATTIRYENIRNTDEHRRFVRRNPRYDTGLSEPLRYRGALCNACAEENHPVKWRQYVAATVRKKMIGDQPVPSFPTRG